MNGNDLHLWGGRPGHGSAYLDANEQDINVVCNQTSASGYVNLRCRQVQARNVENTMWVPMAASAFNTQSSRRYKENIRPITAERIACIYDIPVKTYDYKDGVVGPKTRYNRTGVIAEEVAAVIPEAVTYRMIDGQELPDTVDYSKFVPYLIAAVQAQREEIEELKSLLCTYQYPEIQC